MRPPDSTNTSPDGTCTPITTRDYWDASWRGTDVPDPVDPAVDTAENRLHRALDARFTAAFAGRQTHGARLIEIGCGGSRWLPYFHRRFGFEISGIDYSPAGLQLSDAILRKAGIGATLVQADLFAPPSDFVEAFDVVTSFGVIEHFEPTSRAVAACARYLRPGGLMITEVPTMRGPYGLFYRLTNPSLYRAHVPQSRTSLARAHADAGLQVHSCDYILSAPSVLTRPTTHTSAARRTAFAASRAYLWLEQRGLGIPPNGLTSPYALCIASRPGPA